MGWRPAVGFAMGNYGLLITVILWLIPLSLWNSNWVCSIWLRRVIPTYLPRHIGMYYVDCVYCKIVNKL
jgi:hypothetical protein